MNSIMCSARDLTSQEWEDLRVLYVKAFVTMSESVSAEDLALMGNNPAEFWADVFDRDKPKSHAENYTFNMTREGERIVAYGLYTYASDAQYLYIHHFVVHPDYQGQGLGKRLMYAMQELYVDTQKVGLLTRTYNLQAQNFYKHLGFSPSIKIPAAIHEYYSSDRVYMERIVS
ncbi:MAG: GNAT family N-acetyltransferase [Chlamydiales bacterium]|nr:GNAT family N-acetyltransferase [Chlamydiales bacterium]